MSSSKYGYGMGVDLQDRATPRLRRLRESIRNNPDLKRVVSFEASECFRAHFEKLDAARHNAASPHHFYGLAAAGTVPDIVGGHPAVVIASVGIAQRRFGGTLRPRKGKYLTIPISDEARKHDAPWFDNLFVFTSKRGNKILASEDTGKPMFVLKESITQVADKSVFPSAQALAKAMDAGIQNYIETKG